MKLLELIVAAGGRVAGGEPFGWNSFGPDAWFLDFTDADGNMFCHGIYDTRTFCVYRVELEQPNGFTAIQWTDPGYLPAYIAECKSRDVDPDIAWDNCKIINLHNEHDVLTAVTRMLNSCPDQ